MNRRQLYGLSFIVQILIAPFVAHDWDAFVFTRTVRDWLSGATPYAIAELDPTYIHLGTSWPAHNTWYAYPPLPLLLMTPTLALAHAGAPWVIRIALKLPFIAGTLLLAWVGGTLVDARGKKTRERFERLVLLNPFLIFVAAGWGMFDAWMVALLLLSILLIEHGRISLAGVAFGASALVKLFPLFAAPALFFYVAARASRRWADALRYAGAAAATFVVVSLPFFVPHPQGFVQQVVRMHIDRPPQGLSIIAVLSELGRFAAASGWVDGAPSFHTLAALTFSITIGLTIATTITAARANGTASLVRALLGLFLGVLFTSKVLNEQYFVIPVALYAIALCASDKPWAFAGYRAFTFGALAASLLLGWHFLTFFPADVAESLFGHRPHVLVARLGDWSGLSAATFAVLPTLLSALALVPAFVLGTKRIIKDTKAGVRLLVAMLRRFVPRGRWAALVLLAPIAVQAAGLRASRPPATPALDSAHRHVGAFYYLWWANPSHDPAIDDGNWRDGVSEVPSDGYYTVTAAKLQRDFRLARAHGIDLMVTSFHAYDAPLVPTALQAAYEQDLVVAPLVELGEIYVRPEFGKPHDGFTLTPTTAAAIVDLTSKGLALYAQSPAAYRPHGRLAVFYFDSYFYGPDWRPTTTDQLVEVALRLADDEARARGAPAPSRAELQETLPQSFEAMLADVHGGPLWRRAYVELYQAFWKGIRGELEARFGPIFIFSGESWNPGAAFHHGAETAIDGLDVFDAAFMYSPSFVWVSHKTDSYERNWQRWMVRSVLQTQYARGAGQPVVATVVPAYDDRVARRKNGFEIPPVGPRGSTYDLTWDLALGFSPDLVLVSTWNEFFEGSAIEPTTAYGDALLNATDGWSARAHAARDSKKRGLVLTAESSSHLADGVVDPSVLGRYARNVQVVVERDLPDWTFDAVDIRAAARLDLSKYQLVIVELGMSVPSSTSFVPRLEEWVRGGGRVLLSNPADAAWQASAGGSASDAAEGTTRIAPALVLPPAAQPRVWNLGDADVFLRYADGSAEGRAGAWSRRVGLGMIVGTSMSPTGRDTYPGADATALFCASVRPLLEPNDRCESTRSNVVP
jgi:hypothetical protein